MSPKDKNQDLISAESGNEVLISESEYESMLETQYLLSTPANREWILKSIAEADKGHTARIEFPITLDRAQKQKAPPKASKSKSKK